MSHDSKKVATPNLLNQFSNADLDAAGAFHFIYYITLLLIGNRYGSVKALFLCVIVRSMGRLS